MHVNKTGKKQADLSSSTSAGTLKHTLHTFALVMIGERTDRDVFVVDIVVVVLSLPLSLGCLIFPLNSRDNSFDIFQVN